MMLNRLTGLAAFVAVGICAALAPSAKADEAPIRTVYWKHELFTKGEPFEVECERGSYLVGFDGQAGAWIDHLRVVCARWDAVRGKLEQPVVLEERKVGHSKGGKAAGARCPAGTGIAGEYDEHYAADDSSYILHTLQFHCVDAADGMRPRWRMFGSTEPLAAEYSRPHPHAGCPAGYLATGIYGRAGEFIDRLFGFVCRRRPEAFLAGEKANDAAKAKSYNSKWAVSGTRRVGNDIVAGGADIVAGGDTPPPSQQPPAQKTATAKADVNIHEKATGASRVLGIMRKDKTFPVVASDPEGDWYLLQFDGAGGVPNGQGWVTRSWLTISQ